jgi:ribosomal protein L29
MKKDTLQKLRDKNKEDLQKELRVTKDNLWQLRADLASGKVKNVKEIHKLKKTVAVVNTLLNEK